MERTEWFKRKFDRIDDNGLLPGIIERIEGTPIRIEYKVSQIAKNLEEDEGDKWSVKEEIGHLWDLEPLWYGRVLEIKSGQGVLREADLKNTKTHQANHNEKTIEYLIQQFAQDRARLVHEFRNATAEELIMESTHPRLRSPMRLIDLAFFIAEHDDHHLAQITHLLEVSA